MAETDHPAVRGPFDEGLIHTQFCPELYFSYYNANEVKKAHLKEGFVKFCEGVSGGEKSAIVLIFYGGITQSLERWPDQARRGDPLRRQSKPNGRFVKERLSDQLLTPATVPEPLLRF